MEAFQTHTGIGVPLRRSNVDTDQIIPAVYLKRVTRTGFEDGLFAAWRSDPSFVLNLPPFDRGSVLVAGPDFGTGSSREHAPWALKDYGIRAVISTSFADIFYNNCFQNGILPVVLPQDAVDALMRDAGNGANARITVDLERQVVTGADGAEYPFQIDAHRRHNMLEGLDDIGLTLEKSPAIGGYEDRIAQSQPWV